MTPACSIVIPCRNEAAAIGAVLTDLHATFAGRSDVEIVVVDDRSSDATASVAAAHPSRPRVVRVQHGRGYGDAIKAGVRAATGVAVCIVDGDGQHHATDAARLVAQVDSHTLVVGRRPDETGGSRRHARSLLRWWSRGVGGHTIHDSNSGMMAFPRPLVVRMLPFLPGGMAFSDSLKLFFPLLGLNVAEVDIAIAPRAAGQSKNDVIQGLRTVLSMVAMVVLINPTRVFLPGGLALIALGIGWGVPFLVAGRGLTTGASALVLAGVLVLFAGLGFRVMSGIVQSLVLGRES